MRHTVRTPATDVRPSAGDHRDVPGAADFPGPAAAYASTVTSVTHRGGRPAVPAQFDPTATLSTRARRVGAAYAGPGAGSDIPAGDRPPVAFTAGLPDPVIHPIPEILEATAAVLASDADGALQYGGAQGFAGLREWLAAHWSRVDGLPLTADHFTLTNGAAGALANVCDTYLDDGDVVIVEEFSFPGSVRAIRAATPHVQTVPVDGDGLDLDALAALLQRLERAGTPVRMLYTIPTFQNPTGSTLSLERRRALIELCARHRTLIVEDAAYAELPFHDGLPPSLYSLSDGANVIRIGTASKIIAPGLRVGWCQAVPEVIGALVATRPDMGTSPLTHRMVAELATSGFLDRHIVTAREHYAHKSRIMLEALIQHCGEAATWKAPDGGFFVWATLSDAIDPSRLAALTAQEGVSYVGGQVFLSDAEPESTAWRHWAPGESRYLRLAFSYVAENSIAEGISRLGRALDRARR
jgi:2-aminoadipate transaminase